MQVPPADNYFAALNSAVFTDGSFVYIPKGVKCPMELSTYFRINAEETGQVQPTLSLSTVCCLLPVMHEYCLLFASSFASGVQPKLLAADLEYCSLTSQLQLCVVFQRHSKHFWHFLKDCEQAPACVTFGCLCTR